MGILTTFNWSGFRGEGHGPGTYEVTLQEGEDLPDTADYSVYFKVDKSATETDEVTVWDVAHTTVKTTPQNTSRQTLGLGEVVQLYITPTPNPEKLTAEDVGWDLSGSGKLPARDGYIVEYTGLQSESEATITATIGGYGISVPFTVIPPDSISVGSTVKEIGYGVQGPPNNYVGTKVEYTLTANPTSVNFYNANFKEIIPSYSVHWPNGDTTGGAEGVEFQVSDSNEATDTHSTGKQPIDVLKGLTDTYFTTPNTIGYVYCNGDCDKDPAPISFGKTKNRTQSFRKSDSKAQIDFDDVLSQWAGPWQ